MMFTRFEKTIFAILAGGLALGLALTYASDAKNLLDHSLDMGFGLVGVSLHMMRLWILANPITAGLIALPGTVVLAFAIQARSARRYY